MVKRRDFLKALGAAGAGVAGFALGNGLEEASGEQIGGAAINPLQQMWEAPPSEGYLVVDRAKCAGCRSCMLACSLAHEGEENLSLSRIQVTENSFAGFPDDLLQQQCRQCQYPECVAACPTGALHVDEMTGNVRLVDEEKCIGCQRCIYACGELYEQARPVWNHKEQHSQKCDLCANTPYWEEDGGPMGSQACVEVCPVDAIEFTDEIPVQIGSQGYKINLRDQSWATLGFSTATKYSETGSPYEEGEPSSFS